MVSFFVFRFAAAATVTVTPGNKTASANFMVSPSLHNPPKSGGHGLATVTHHGNAVRSCVTEGLDYVSSITEPRRLSGPARNPHPAPHTRARVRVRTPGVLAGVSRGWGAALTIRSYSSPPGSGCQTRPETPIPPGGRGWGCAPGAGGWGAALTM